VLSTSGCACGSCPSSWACATSSICWPSSIRCTLSSLLGAGHAVIGHGRVGDVDDSACSIRQRLCPYRSCGMRLWPACLTASCNCRRAISRLLALHQTLAAVRSALERDLRGCHTERAHCHTERAHCHTERAHCHTERAHCPVHAADDALHDSARSGEAEPLISTDEP